MLPFPLQVYVDEVQDFTQSELRLFLEICANKNALLLTGDTCQTIARGVGFRFEELTTMFTK
jgi:superfamily I DNA and RNA helicase